MELKEMISDIWSGLFKEPQELDVPRKYNVGDICTWNDPKSGKEITGEVTFYTFEKCHDGTYNVLYDVTDFYHSEKYCFINESELQLLATAEEIDESVSPFELELLYKNICKNAF